MLKAFMVGRSGEKAFWQAKEYALYYYCMFYAWIIADAMISCLLKYIYMTADAPHPINKYVINASPLMSHCSQQCYAH